MAKKYVGLKLLTERLADKKDITKKDAEAQIKNVVGIIKDAILDRDFDGVSLVDFINLVRVDKAERQGRNPKTKENIIIPAKTSVKAKVGKAFESELNSAK